MQDNEHDEDLRDLTIQLNRNHAAGEKTRNGIHQILHVHNVADERPIPDIITIFAKATAAATVGEMTPRLAMESLKINAMESLKINMFKGTDGGPPDLVQTGTTDGNTFDCTQHRVRDGDRLQLSHGSWVGAL